jgi:hypothetical protein
MATPITTRRCNDRGTALAQHACEHCEAPLTEDTYRAVQFLTSTVTRLSPAAIRDALGVELDLGATYPSLGVMRGERQLVCDALYRVLDFPPAALANGARHLRECAGWGAEGRH